MDMETEVSSGAVGVTVERKRKTALSFGGSTVLPARTPSDRNKSSDASPASSRLSRIFDAIITTSLVAIFFGLPIFFTGLSLQGITFEKQIYFYFWILIGIIGWVSKGVILGEMKIRRTPLDIPVLVFLGVYALATIFSTNRWDSFWGTFGDPSRGFLSVAALTLAYFLIVSHFNRKRLLLMFGGLAASAFLVVVWSFFTIMAIHFLPASIEAYAPLSLLGTVTTLALFLSASLIVFMTALFALFHEDTTGPVTWKRWVPTALLLIGLLLDLFLILALYSFVSWPVLIGGLGFFLIFILAQIVRPAQRWAWVPMVVFVLVLAFLMFDSFPIARTQLPVEVIPTFSFAFDIAKSAVRDRFFLGSGPATYGSVFSLYRPIEYNQNSLFTLRFDQTPGTFLEALSTLGAIGTIAYLVLLLSFVSIGIYLLSNDKNRNKLYSLGIWSVAIMFFIASFISAFNGPILLLSALIASLAVVTALWESGTEARYLTLSLKASPKFALALAFVFMVVSAGVAFLFVFLGKVLIADISAGMSFRDTSVNDNTVALLGRATSLNPREGQYLLSLGQAYLSLANQEAAKPDSERDTNKIKNYITAAIQVTESAYALAPESVRTAEAAGLIYENSALYAPDALSKAFDYYKKASDLEPNNPVLLVKLGQMKRSIGDNIQAEGADKTAAYQDSKGYFEAAVEKKSDLGIAHYNLAISFSRLKDYSAAIDEASKALLYESTNATYAYSLGTLYQLRKGDGDLDRAQKIYENILASNEKLIDVRLALGLVHEEKKEKDQALAQYKQILTYLPAGNDGDALRKQVGTFIDTLQSGGGNITKATPPAPAVESAPVTTEQATPQTTPITPAATPAATPAGTKKAGTQTTPTPTTPVK